MREQPLIGVTPGYAAPSETRDFCRSANVYYCDQNYLQRVEEAGGVPLLLAHVGAAGVTRLAEMVHGLLLTGGEDVHPEHYGQEVKAQSCVISEARDGFELALLQAVLARRRPVLAVCRGVQLLNVALGGTLLQDLPLEIGSAHHSQKRPSALPTHDVRLQSGSRIARCFGTETLAVNSHHHQAVDALGVGLTAVGWSEEGIVEAVEHDTHPFVMGVQWHPERLASEYAVQQRLFAEFVQACREDGHGRAA